MIGDGGSQEMRTQKRSVLKAPEIPGFGNDVPRNKAQQCGRSDKRGVLSDQGKTGEITKKSSMSFAPDSPNGRSGHLRSRHFQIVRDI